MSTIMETYIALFIFLEFRLVSTILGISTQLSMFRSNNPGSIRLNNLRTYFIWPTSFSKMKHVYTYYLGITSWNWLIT